MKKGRSSDSMIIQPNMKDSKYITSIKNVRCVDYLVISTKGYYFSYHELQTQSIKQNYTKN